MFQLVVLYISEFVFTIQCCMIILFYYYSTNTVRYIMFMIRSTPYSDQLNPSSLMFH